jgi:hypothetical protein
MTVFSLRFDSRRYPRLGRGLGLATFFQQIYSVTIRTPLKQMTVAARKNMAATIVRFWRSSLRNSKPDSKQNVRLRSSVKIPQKRQARSIGHCVAFANDAKNSMVLKTSSTVSPLNIKRRLEYNVFIKSEPTIDLSQQFMCLIPDSQRFEYEDRLTAPRPERRD